jgi:iron complex outermembrane recepter protein
MVRNRGINNILFFQNPLFSHISFTFALYLATMYFFRLSLFLLVFCIAFSNANAQPGKPTTGSISGKLVDANNAPVSYATVTLLRTDSSVVSGDLSKDDGSFSISPTGTGNFLLRIESMGLAKKIINVEIPENDPHKKMGKIKLSAGENKLGEVTVVGEKPIMELKVDKKVFNVEKNTTTAGGSATDVLQNVPSVSVELDGTVALRGKSDVTILIDGKPATMFGSDLTSALQSLPAASIESVEVITNPSAKYDAQGSTGIINIITKKDGRFGMNGNITLGAGTNDKYNGNFGLNARKGKWNVFMNSSARQNRTYNDITTDRYDKDALGNVTKSYHTFEHSPRHFDGFFNTAGASYDADKYNSFTITGNVNRMRFGYTDNSDYHTYTTPDEIPSSLSSQQLRNTDFGVNIFSISSALDYKRKFKKKDEELSVDATYAHTDFDRKQTFVTNNYYVDTLGKLVIDSLSPVYSNAPAKGGNSSFNAWADYSDPLFTKNGKLGLGFKSQIYWFFSSDNPTVSDKKHGDTVDVSLLASYNYTQQTHAAYVNWNDQLGKFSYQVGLRFEDAIYDATGDIPTHATFHNDFANFFPSAFISYQLPKQQSVYLNYSRRVNRPGFMQLIPFKDYSNPGTVSMGNPNLIPEFINNIEFSYSKADNRGDNFILSTYYSYSENLTQRVPRPITGDPVDIALGLQNDVGKLLSMPVNIASGTTYGIEGTGHIQIIKIWDATVNLNFFQNQLNIGEVNPVYKKYLTDNSGNSWFGKVNSNLKLPKNFSLQVNANYESPKVIAQGSVKETYWVDVAIRKNLWKNKATVILNCSDIFNTHTSYTNYNLSSYYETINRLRETRVVNLTFTYRFGKADLGKNEKRGKPAEDKAKPQKPDDEERDKNLKEKDDNDQPGGGGERGGQKREGKGSGSGATH